MLRTHEQNLNVRLGQLLRGRFLLRAESESRLRGRGRGRADVRVQFGSHIIIVEAKGGQNESQKRAALRDAEARLDNNHCQMAVAVCYPDDATEDNLHQEQLLYAIIDHDNRTPEWLKGTPGDLAAAIKLAPGQLGNADFAAAMLSGEITKAVDKLSFLQKQALASRLDLPATPQPRKKSGQSNDQFAKALVRWETTRFDTAAIRGLLVIASAVMFHARLDQHLSVDNRPSIDARTPDGQAYVGEWPPARADQCVQTDNVISAMADAWDTVLALDYKPVFQTAIAGLRAPNPDANWRDAVKVIASEALNLTGSLAGGRHDVMGRIFHRVLDTAPYDGSYYTGTAGATLLATLSVRLETAIGGTSTLSKE